MITFLQRCRVQTNMRRESWAEETVMLDPSKDRRDNILNSHTFSWGNIDSGYFVRI